MPFAAIYVPDFPLEAIVRAEPALREQAVAVMEGTPPLLRVIACNARAAEAGVEMGMSRVQVSACLPEAGIRLRSAALEASAHAALVDCACAFSPCVEETAADAVLLDLAGTERIFGSPSKIACDVVRRCSHVGLEVNVAVAFNPDAALLAARGFAGVTVIPAGKEGERLGELPVEVLLGISNFWMASAAPQKGRAQAQRARAQQQRRQEILETLDRWGVRNLRALAALLEVAVSERLGQEGLHLQRLARGTRSRALVAMEPPLEFEEVAELEYPIELLEPLAFVLNRMLEQLCARLEARALVTHELRLRLELDSPQRRGNAEENISDFRFPNCDLSRQAGTSQRMQESSALPRCGEPVLHERTLHVPVAMRDAKMFLKLLQLDLKTSPPGAPVQKIWLRAEPVQPRTSQAGLFLPSTPPPEKLELTLARIAGIVNPLRRCEDVEENPLHRQGDRERSDLRFGNCDLGQEQQRASANHKSEVANQKFSVSTRLRVEPVSSRSANQQWLGSPELLDSHHPGAFRMKRFVPPEAAGSGASASTSRKQATSPVTALRVLRPPVAVSVVMREGHPAQLTSYEHPDFCGQIIWCAGPWRSSGEWWESGGADFPRSSDLESASQLETRAEMGWSREEWEVAVRNRAGIVMCRLCRENEVWVLEGVYD